MKSCEDCGLVVCYAQSEGVAEGKTGAEGMLGVAVLKGGKHVVGEFVCVSVVFLSAVTYASGIATVTLTLCLYRTQLAD